MTAGDFRDLMLTTFNHIKTPSLRIDIQNQLKDFNTFKEYWNSILSNPNPDSFNRCLWYTDEYKHIDIKSLISKVKSLNPAYINGGSIYYDEYKPINNIFNIFNSYLKYYLWSLDEGGVTKGIITCERIPLKMNLNDIIGEYLIDGDVSSEYIGIKNLTTTLKEGWVAIANTVDDSDDVLYIGWEDQDDPDNFGIDTYEFVQEIDISDIPFDEINNAGSLVDVNVASQQWKILATDTNLSYTPTFTLKKESSTSYDIDYDTQYNFELFIYDEYSSTNKNIICSGSGTDLNNFSIDKGYLLISPDDYTYRKMIGDNKYRINLDLYNDTLIDYRNSTIELGTNLGTNYDLSFVCNVESDQMNTDSSFHRIKAVSNDTIHLDTITNHLNSITLNYNTIEQNVPDVMIEVSIFTGVGYLDKGHLGTKYKIKGGTNFDFIFDTSRPIYLYDSLWRSLGSRKPYTFTAPSQSGYPVKFTVSRNEMIHLLYVPHISGDMLYTDLNVSIPMKSNDGTKKIRILANIPVFGAHINSSNSTTYTYTPQTFMLSMNTDANAYSEDWNAITRFTTSNSVSPFNLRRFNTNCDENSTLKIPVPGSLGGDILPSVVYITVSSYPNYIPKLYNYLYEDGNNRYVGGLSVKPEIPFSLLGGLSDDYISSTYKFSNLVEMLGMTSTSGVTILFQ